MLVLTEREAANRLGMARRTFQRRREKCRYFPAPVAFAAYGGALYAASAIDEYATVRPVKANRDPRRKGKRCPPILMEGESSGLLGALNGLVEGAPAGHWFGCWVRGEGVR